MTTLKTAVGQVYSPITNCKGIFGAKAAEMDPSVGRNILFMGLFWLKLWLQEELDGTQFDLQRGLNCPLGAETYLFNFQCELNLLFTNFKLEVYSIEYTRFLKNVYLPKYFQTQVLNNTQFLNRINIFNFCRWNHFSQREKTLEKVRTRRVPETKNNNKQLRTILD